jgi:hypothetical protein
MSADVIQLPQKNQPHEIVRHEAAVAQVREIFQRFRRVEGCACIIAMELGDALIPYRKTAAHGAWASFLRDCDIPKRDAQIAIQLAKHRPQIEEANAKRASHLSIREALKLIRPKKPKPEQPEPNPPEAVAIAVPAITINDVLAWLSQASTEDKRKITTALARDTEAMKKILPAKALPPKATAEQVFRKAMGLLLIDDSPAVH